MKQLRIPCRGSVTGRNGEFGLGLRAIVVTFRPINGGFGNALDIEFESARTGTILRAGATIRGHPVANLWSALSNAFCPTCGAPFDEDQDGKWCQRCEPGQCGECGVEDGKQRSRTA